jgi:putative hemolysin
VRDRAQSTAFPLWVMAVPIVVVGAIVLMQLPEAIEASQAFSDWCAAQGGNLYNAQVIGDHGGLHCELPNGTTVHADQVTP